MKIKVNQKKLQLALKQLQKVLPKKGSNPILTAVYFSLSNGVLTLRVTDLAVGEEVRVEVPEAGAEEVTILVPGKALIDAIGMFGQEETSFEIDAEQMILRNGKDRVVLTVLQSDDFPKFSFELTEADEMPVALVAEIDKKIALAVSNDISRPQLTGVYFKFTGEKLSLVGTDGFRLSLLDVKNFSARVEGNSLVPMKALKDVLGLAEAYGVKELKVYWNAGAGRVVFASEEFLYFTSLIESAFPPYERIVPLSFATEIVINREDLVQMLNKASVFARDASNIVRMKFHDQQLDLMAKGLNGIYEGELELGEVVPEAFQIAFNIKYLVDFLSVLKGDEVWWGVNENTKPVLLAGKRDDEYRYVAMPFKATD